MTGRRQGDRASGSAGGGPVRPGHLVGPGGRRAGHGAHPPSDRPGPVDGATLLSGGVRLGGELAAGWFVAPTVFGDVDHGSDLARNEVFGPVQSLLRFTSDDEVLALANDSPFGLAAYLHTKDLAGWSASSGGWRPARSWSTVSGRISPAALRGHKQSGFGREGGRDGIEEMVQPRPSTPSFEGDGRKVGGVGHGPGGRMSLSDDIF